MLLGKERSLSPSHRIKRPSDLNGTGVEGQSEEGLSDKADTSSNDGSNISSNPGQNYRKLQSPIIPRELIIISNTHKICLQLFLLFLLKCIFSYYHKI